MNQIEISNSSSRMLPPPPAAEIAPKEATGQAFESPTPDKIEKKQQTSGGFEVPEKDIQERISPEELQKEIEKANSMLKESKAKHLSFFVDDATGKQGVKVVDTKTDEVIRQFPPEETLNIAARIREQLGALVDQVA